VDAGCKVVMHGRANGSAKGIINRDALKLWRPPARRDAGGRRGLARRSHAGPRARAGYDAVLPTPRCESRRPDRDGVAVRAGVEAGLFRR